MVERKGHRGRTRGGLFRSTRVSRVVMINLDYDIDIGI